MSSQLQVEVVSRETLSEIERKAIISLCSRAFEEDYESLLEPLKGSTQSPFPKTQRLEQWKALIELRRQGKVRAIGVSNFNEAHIEEIKAAELPLPDANQIELHPWSQKPGLVSYLAEKGGLNSLPQHITFT